MKNRSTLPAEFLSAMLEHYVLWCIDELEPEWQARLQDREAELSALFRSGGHWHEMLAERMEFGAGLPESIRSLWARNQEVARARGEVLSPREFASGIVKKNFEIPGGAEQAE